MNFIRNIAQILVYSNFIIAFCASSLCYVSIILFDLGSYKLETLGFVFFATIFMYGFHRKMDHLYYGNRNITNQDEWIKKHELAYNWLLIGSFLFSFNFFTCLPKSTTAIIFPLLLISLLYILKFNFGIKVAGLRSIPYLKPFLIAFVWGGTSTFLPIVNNYGLEALWVPEYHSFAFAVCLFVFGQAIPFDIRDYLLDQEANLKTLPHLLGNKKTKQISFIAYSLSLFVLLNFVSISNLNVLAFGIGLLFSGIIIKRLSENHSDLHFSLIHESSLTFPLICLIIFQHF